MITLVLSTEDLSRTTLAYSPLAEVTSSLRMLSSGRVPALHQPWYADAKPRLRRLDWDVLKAIAPYRHRLPDLLFQPSVGSSSKIEHQLRLLAETTAEQFSIEMHHTWADGPMPSAAKSLIADRSVGPQRVAEALWDYWTIALDPYWPQVRAALEDDLFHRTRVLAETGMAGVFAGIHPQVHVIGRSMVIDKPDTYVQDLRGVGLQLVPSVFVGSHLALGEDQSRAPSIAYPARRASRLWTSSRPTDVEEKGTLSALFGKARAAILSSIELPQSTTSIAEMLGLSAACVNQHLSLLRRCGMLVSWRSGRFVLYQRTALADRVVAMNAPHSADVPQHRHDGR